MPGQAAVRLDRVVETCCCGGRTEAEITDVLQFTGRTVRRHRNKARLRLGAMLEA